MDRSVCERVAEELEEFLGWQPHPESPGKRWTKGCAQWRDLGGGFSILEVFDEPEYKIEFGPNVPHYQIVCACIEATACPHCGTACKGDCGEPDGVMPGVDGNGHMLSHHEG